MTFSDFGLDPKILKAIQESGYKQPTPIQSEAIPVIMTGKDVIGIAQTGTGKTAAFTLPVLNRLLHTPMPHVQGEPRKPRALFLAPTRELVAQIDQNVRTYGSHLPLKVAKVFGGVGEGQQKDALRAGCDIIIATPGRLLDFMSQRVVEFRNLTHLVLDEADRMLDMGFLPDVRKIIRTLPNKRQTLMFSATFSREIQNLTKEFQYSPKVVEIGNRSDPAETVDQAIYEVPQHLKLQLLSHLLEEDEQMRLVLVFTRTKYGADRVARKLGQSGVSTAVLHSNRTQNQRLRALHDFQNWKVRVLVATDIAARGIDVDGITHVVNFDFPMHAEDYVHRIGRTGRAEAVGAAYSFATPEDKAYVTALEDAIDLQLPRKRAAGFDYKVPPPDQPKQHRPGKPGGSKPGGGSGGPRLQGGKPDLPPWLQKKKKTQDQPLEGFSPAKKTARPGFPLRPKGGKPGSGRPWKG